MQKNKLNLHTHGVHLLNPYKTVVSHLKSNTNFSAMNAGRAGALCRTSCNCLRNNVATLLSARFRHEVCIKTFGTSAYVDKNRNQNWWRYVQMCCQHVVPRTWILRFKLTRYYIQMTIRRYFPLKYFKDDGKVISVNYLGRSTSYLFMIFICFLSVFFIFLLTSFYSDLKWFYFLYKHQWNTKWTFPWKLQIFTREEITVVMVT